MSVCDVCGGVTADHGRHLKWHRTMSNRPPQGGVALTDIRVADPWHDFGGDAHLGVRTGRTVAEPTPIYDTVLADMEAERAEHLVVDFIALGEEHRAFPAIQIGANAERYQEGMRRLTAVIRAMGPTL